MELLNSNKVSSETANIVSTEGPTSPVLSSNKITRRIIKNRKKHRSKTKIDNELSAHFDASQGNNLIEGRLKTIEKLECERKEYHSLLCSKVPTPEIISVDRKTQNIKQSMLPVQQNLILIPDGKTVRYCINQFEGSTEIQTASGKKIKIPDDALKASKGIFDDILNEDATINPAVLKCPIKSKMKKMSKIPVFNRNAKPKDNSTCTESTTNTPVNDKKQTEAIKIISDKVVSNTLIEVLTGNDSVCKSLLSNITLVGSLVEANKSEMDEEKDVNGDAKLIESKSNPNTMNKLYSNQKFGESSSSTNSLGDSVSKESLQTLDSEVYMKPSQLHLTVTESCPPEIINPDVKVEANDSTDLLVTEIMNDDWSDTMHIPEIAEANSTLIVDTKDKSVDNNVGTDSENQRLYVPSTTKIETNQIESQKEQENINCDDWFFSNHEIKNVGTLSNKLFNLFSNTNSKEIKSNEDHSADLVPDNFDEVICNEESEISPSKSLVSVDIPISTVNFREKSYSKNLIELHRNINFTGNSEDSVSNLDYTLSQHSIHVKKRILKAQKKIADDFLGFDRKTQEIANEQRIIFVNHMKEIEKQICDTGLTNQGKSNRERKSGEKRRKKHKIDAGDASEKNKEDLTSKDNKMKTDSRKKEKTKQRKQSVGAEIPENIVVNKEEGNKTVMYDHLSIVSEQSCKRYKSHKKRKTGVADKDVVHQNVNNQIIELDPSQKKFKIEIDCNSKFRINICCNGVCHKDSRCDNEFNKCNKGVIKYDTENKIGDKPADAAVMKAMFKSASGKDITFARKNLNNAEKVYEQIESSSVANEDNIKPKGNCFDTNKTSDDIPNPIANEDKLIKKFLNRAHKLYRDIKNSDASLNQEMKSEKIKENDLGVKPLQKNNHNLSSEISNDIPGFKFASGKNIKFSEKSLKHAQKLYQDVIELTTKTFQRPELTQTPLNEMVDNVTSTKKERTKQKTRVLYTDIDHSNLSTKVDVPSGCQIVSGKLMVYNNVQNKDLSAKRTQKQNHKIESPVKKTTGLCGFQNASGRNIQISATALEKAERFFIESNRPAGDSTDPTILFTGFQSASGTNIEVSEKNLLDAKEMFTQYDSMKFGMGDFEQVGDMISDSKHVDVDTKTSKKAFELLEDVVETVDSALDKIKKNKIQKPSSVAKRRLGISRCKQINISKEKIEKAKRLFSNENFTESMRDLSVMTTPKNVQVGTSSTPVRENAPLMRDVEFCKNTIESEITPIKNTKDHVSTIIENEEGSCVVLHRKTPGTLDDWHGTILKQINSLKDALLQLENKKHRMEKQMSLVHYGDKIHRRQRVGILYAKKSTNNHRISLKSIRIDGDTNAATVVLNITSRNANMVHFKSSNSENAKATLDGAVVIPNSQNLIGLSEIEMAFRTMPGIEPELIPDGWIANHYRLIVWKLASYERFIPEQLKECLSIENIIQQLKYRYDREIDKAQRPAIRKILEKDDVPQKRMVLCVSNIIEVPSNGIELELTDGWYCVRTIIDDPLVAEVRKKKIKIGTKIIVHGAQILNCDGCHPLQVTDLVKLKITFNCTRRAVWYAKLGYQKCPEPFLVSLESIHPNGGMIGCMKVHIVRVYPIRYMEQIDNKKVWRNSKAEEKFSNTFENERLEKIERIHYSVHDKFVQDLCSEEKGRHPERLKLNTTEMLKMTCPKTLYSLLENSNDPESLMESLLPSQRVKILEYRQQLCLQREQDISRLISEEMERLAVTKRKVTPILKLLILDDYHKSEKPRQFCIWNPKEDDITALKEGCSLMAYNIVPRSNGDLFSNTRTYFKVEKGGASYTKFKRQLFPIAMTLSLHCKPPFNEYDTVGLIVQISINNDNHSLWLTESIGTMLLIKVRDGPALCSLFDGFTKGQVVAISNLIHCKPQREFGLALANQFTVVSSSPQYPHLSAGIEQFKAKLPEDISQLLKECEHKVNKYMAIADIKHNCYLTPSKQTNLTTSLNNTLDTSEDSTVIPVRLTATDVAMSLIDTDKFT